MADCYKFLILNLLLKLLSISLVTASNNLLHRICCKNDVNIAFLAHILKENLYHYAHFGFDSGKLIVKLFLYNYHNIFYLTTDFELVLSRLPGEVIVYHYMH